MGTDEWVSFVVPKLCGKMGMVRASGLCVRPIRPSHVANLVGQ